jgi:hypothetical protein
LQARDPVCVPLFASFPHDFAVSRHRGRAPTGVFLPVICGIFPLSAAISVDKERRSAQICLKVNLNKIMSVNWFLKQNAQLKRATDYKEGRFT